MEEFVAIVPKQPYRPQAVSNEVRMEFEAVLLDAQRERQNQLWIHAKIKACVRGEDCGAVSKNAGERVSYRAMERLLATLRLECISVVHS